MPYLDELPITWINRPYYNLGSFNNGPLHIQRIEFSYRDLIRDKENANVLAIINPITIAHPGSFRESLIRESKLFQYQVYNPLQLDYELRTERWNTLCNYLTHYQELQPVIQLKVVNLLSSLCLHQSVLEYVPVISRVDISKSSALAKLAYSRAISNLLAESNTGTLDNLQEFEKIANHAPLESRARLNSAIELVALFAKTFRDLKAAEFWRSVAIRELDNLKPSFDNFTCKLRTSVCYRAIVFIPLLKNDKEAVVREMDFCESLAEELTHECKNEVEKIAAHENLTTVFESRTKEALWLGDIDLAEERARKMMQMEPLYPKYRLQLGEILIKQGKIEEATKMYRSAARLGPPGTAIAWFMAGQCHEKLGDIDVAFDCYLASVQMDELAISAVECLNRLAPRMGNLAVTHWSNMRLLDLKEQEKQIANQPRTSYIPEASSGLKMEGEKALSKI